MKLELPEKLSRLARLSKNARGTRETARLALKCFDLTSLKGNETEGDIFEICDIAQYNQLSSVCIYPQHIKSAKTALKDSDVIIATVINFSDGIHRTLLDERATAETIKIDVAQAIEDGARQIDMVFPRHYYNDGEILKVKEMLRACRRACESGVTMKCIFETAAFDSAQRLREACRIAIEQNVDCLKTSTGKHASGGATLEAAAILLDEAHHAHHSVGVKISGGVKNNDDCAKFITLARGVRGHNSIRPEFFRIGASTLLDNLISELGSKSPDRISSPQLNNY